MVLKQIPIWSFKVLEKLTYAIPQTITHNSGTEKSNPLSTNKLPLSALKTEFCKQATIHHARKMLSGSIRDLHLGWLQRNAQYRVPALLWEKKALTRRLRNQTLGMPSKLYYFPLGKMRTTAQSESRSKRFARLLPVSPWREPHRREGRDQEDGGQDSSGLSAGGPQGCSIFSIRLKRTRALLSFSAMAK